MGYQVYKLHGQDRFGGYGVPSTCDHPECNGRIDRGMAYCCGGEPNSDANGCGQYFCAKHLGYSEAEGAAQQCERCLAGQDPFPIKPDTQDWTERQMTDESWAEWRAENPELVARYSNTLASGSSPK